MRLTIIGHSLMPKLNRGKYVEMTRLRDDLDITIICPHHWPHPLFSVYPDELDQSLNRMRIVSIRTWFAGKESAYLYDWSALQRTILNARPDVVIVDHSPDALVGLQVLAALRGRNRLIQQGFFTWVNWNQRRDPIRLMVERFALRRYTFGIAGNEDAKDILIEKGFRGPLLVAPQIGVDLDAHGRVDPEAIRQQYGIDEAFVVGFAGRLAKEKGLLTLVRAASQLKRDWRLVLVGRGPMQPEIQAEAERLGVLDRVVFVGSVAPTEIPRYMSAFDCFVLPSESQPWWREQFGHVLIEAMCAGIPVIGSTCGEIPNVIGDAGLVFPERNVEQLYQCLLRMSDKSERWQFSLLGKDRTTRKFTHQALGTELLAFLDSLKS